MLEPHSFRITRTPMVDLVSENLMPKEKAPAPRYPVRRQGDIKLLQRLEIRINHLDHNEIGIGLEEVIATSQRDPLDLETPLKTTRVIMAVALVDVMIHIGKPFDDKHKWLWTCNRVISVMPLMTMDCSTLRSNKTWAIWKINLIANANETNASENSWPYSSLSARLYRIPNVMFSLVPMTPCWLVTY